MKVCTKCHIEKDESEFSRHKSKKDGLQPVCKQCCKVYFRQYYLKNIGKIERKCKQWRDNNRLRKKELDKARYNRNIKTYRDRGKVVMRNQRQELRLAYIKSLLKEQGFSDSDINEIPVLIDKKKLDIIINRSDKLIKKNKKQQS